MTDQIDTLRTVAGPWDELGAPLDLAADGEFDRIRAWTERIGPGEERPAHTHRVPWLTVVVSGGRGRSTLADGTVQEVELTTGQVKLNDLAGGPYRHSMRNVGDTEIVMIGIQLG
jgi:beta-alanine degradation protein BauB